MMQYGKTLFNGRAIEKWLADELTAQRLQGGILALRQGGELIYQNAFGVKDTAGRVVTHDTLYWVASMTKPVVSLAALMLVEKGLLTLTQPVVDFVPGFASKGVMNSDGTYSALKRQPTIRDLLTHTSGLTYSVFTKGLHESAYKAADVFNYANTNQRMATQLASVALKHQPGEYFEYGMSTDLLGYIIEVICGKDLAQALRELIFEPVGMLDSCFNPAPQRLAEIPNTPVTTVVAPSFGRSLNWLSGGAGLCTSVHDYLRFSDVLLTGKTPRGERLLSTQMLLQMRSNQLPADIQYGGYTQGLGISAPLAINGLGFGYGLAVRTHAVATIAGGDGEFLWPGVSGANFWVDPQRDLTVVFLTHSPEHRCQHRIELREIIYASLEKEKTT